MFSRNYRKQTEWKLPLQTYHITWMCKKPIVFPMNTLRAYIIPLKTNYKSSGQQTNKQSLLKQNEKTKSLLTLKKNTPKPINQSSSFMPLKQLYASTSWNNQKLKPSTQRHAYCYSKPITVLSSWNKIKELKPVTITQSHLPL